jgi:hypothetical protein
MTIADQNDAPIVLTVVTHNRLTRINGIAARGRTAGYGIRCSAINNLLSSESLGRVSKSISVNRLGLKTDILRQQQ